MRRHRKNGGTFDNLLLVHLFGPYFLVPCCTSTLRITSTLRNHINPKKSAIGPFSGGVNEPVLIAGGVCGVLKMTPLLRGQEDMGRQHQDNINETNHPKDFSKPPPFDSPAYDLG